MQGFQQQIFIHGELPLGCEPKTDLWALRAGVSLRSWKTPLATGWLNSLSLHHKHKEFTMSTSRPYHHKDLAAALVRAALELLQEVEVSALSLRMVARRAGVSPMAPYR